MIVNVYFFEWSAETMVITYGILHGLGGASVALNLATISYIGDISSPETKVRYIYLKRHATHFQFLPENCYRWPHRARRPTEPYDWLSCRSAPAIDTSHNTTSHSG
jgi:hypothetical protein